jgi:catechol 2,3-dioxygenase-like lactoylglutathione lyase family enzyme
MAFRINHLHLKTPDPKRTIDFYLEYAGAKVVSERTSPSGKKTYRLNLHGVELNVTDFLEEQKLEQFYGLEHVAIDTDNFDGEVNKIKSAGIKILEERKLPDGRRVCFFEGPQGVRLEFLEWKQ